MAQKLNKYSARITQVKSQGASQAMLYGTGMTDEDMSKAEVGIATVWWEGNTCNMHLNDLAAKLMSSSAMSFESRICCVIRKQYGRCDCQDKPYHGHRGRRRNRGLTEALIRTQVRHAFSHASNLTKMVL